VHEAVTTIGRQTGVQAGVAVGAVAVVAFLDAAGGNARTVFALAGMQCFQVNAGTFIGAQVAVTAGGQLAGIKAEVSINIVSVVALLYAGPQVIVTAGSQGAVVQAGVCIDGVAVVARLAGVGQTVAALVQALVVAAVAVVGVAVVALFTGQGVKVPVSAYRQRAVGVARGRLHDGIAFFLVTVIVNVVAAVLRYALRVAAITAFRVAVVAFFRVAVVINAITAEFDHAGRVAAVASNRVAGLARFAVIGRCVTRCPQHRVTIHTGARVAPYGPAIDGARAIAV